MKSYYDDAQTPSGEMHVFSSKSAKPTRETVMDMNPAALDVRYDVAFQIGQSVPEVQALFTQLEGRILRVWTVVPERDDAIYRKIYAREKEIIRAFDGMEFEFNVIPSLGKSPREAVPDPACSIVFER